MSIRQLVRQWLVRRLRVPEIPSALSHLASKGFAPKLVADIGAYHGEFATLCRTTFGTKGHFPEIICFEVLRNALAKLREMESKALLRVVPCLLGSQDLEKVEFHEKETASSVLLEHHSNNGEGTTQKMRRLDTVVAEELSGRPPDLIKIDTQGYELEVLKGAENTLASARVILAELNLLDIHQNVPLANEVIAWLGQRGWTLYDIAGLTRRPLDGALWQSDFIFVKRDDPLRQDKRWSA